MSARDPLLPPRRLETGGSVRPPWRLRGPGLSVWLVQFRMALRRYTPEELLATFRTVRKGVSTAHFFGSPKHQRTKDMWCAAHFASGYGGTLGGCAVWFDAAGTDTDTDFELEVSGTRFPFQTTMVKTSGRRIGDEYKLPHAERPRHNDLSVGAELGPAWALDEIQKKIGKMYSAVDRLNLLLYLNFPAWQQDYREYQAVCRDAASRFASVWLLNGNALCVLHANPAIPAFDGWLPIGQNVWWDEDGLAES